MKKIGKFSLNFIILVCALISACSPLKTIPETPYHQSTAINLALSAHSNSAFQQVEANFTTARPLQLVYLVISNLKLTPSWFDGLSSIEVLEQINNNQFLLRSIMNSPWPFKQRELITCVTTKFSQQLISINIESCSDKHPMSASFVRVKHAYAHWEIQQVNNKEVNVNYTAWLNPQGNVPANFFNSKLSSSSRKSLQKLQHLIHSARHEDFVY